jgi:hypothetical protein
LNGLLSRVISSIAINSFENAWRRFILRLKWSHEPREAVAAALVREETS